MTNIDDGSEMRTYVIDSDESTIKFVNFIYGDDYILTPEGKRASVLEIIRAMGGVYVNTDNEGYILVKQGSLIKKISNGHFVLVKESLNED